MKIAFTTKGTDWDSEIDPRFGRSEFFLFYNEEKDEFTYFDNRAIEKEAHGAGPRSAQKLSELDPDVLITGNGPGDNAVTVLEKASIKIYLGAGDMSVREAYDAFKNNTLITY
jgi:predicted Fe-Mo cluster-binding NifX family protein